MIGVGMKNIMRNTAGATLITGFALLSSCGNKVYKKANSELVTTATTHVLDSLKKEGEKIAKDTNYFAFYQDTVKLPKNFAKNPEEFLNKLEKKGNDCNPNQTIIEHTSNTVFKTGDDWGVEEVAGVELVESDEKFYHFIKPVIKEGVFTDQNGKNVYIPVSWYGMRNN